MRSRFARAADAPGFYGKVPALGDFVSRRIPAGFLPVWDGWLRRLMHVSRENLGADWLPAWLEAPVWHFALGAGVAGPGACFGVLIPSVDRVGRHFPFTVLAAVREDGVALEEWSGRAETLVLSALDDGFDPGRLDADLTALGNPGSDPIDWAASAAAGETLWRCRDAPRVPATLLRATGLPDERQSVLLVAAPRPDHAAS